MPMHKIAILGGSFDPPHLGHMTAARGALESLDIDKLLLIPAAVPPHKEPSERSPGDRARLEMLSLAAARLPKTEVSDIEMVRGGRSYTADTVDELLKLYPDAEFYLLVGADLIADFEKWYRYKSLLDNVTLTVFARGHEDSPQVTATARYLTEKHGARCLVLDKEILDVSSTRLRELLPERRGASFLDAEVYAYIIRGRCYGAKPELGWLRNQIRRYVDGRRLEHTLGCESEAVRLAERWGVDSGDAAEAAILHDITKQFTREEQLKLCGRYGIITDSVEKGSEKLLHSKTGAALAREEFGAPDEISNAILWHTTGRAGMTLLEKIIYMADYIEPTRSFEGVEELRKLAYEDLDAAVRLGLSISVGELRQKGHEVHIRTAEALRELAASDLKGMNS